jgi:hypothetical protein
MFKHVTPHPWTAGNLTVWGYMTERGRSLVSNCGNKNLPTATQRANARLISIAPQMFEIIRGLTNNDEAQMLVKYMEKDAEDEDSTT